MSRYIDANKLIEMLRHNFGFMTAPKHSKDGIIDEIVYQPTADVVEVKHGEWLEQYEGSRLLKCSVCGYEYCDLIECLNYCGNCGAKMDGERKEENEG